MSDIEFTCPECGEAIEMNAAMREVTLSEGCPVCGADVTPAAFRETASR
ncbi:MAG: zinc ribbon domain-containing protein [Halobacteriales archaeon]